MRLAMALGVLFLTAGVARAQGVGVELIGSACPKVVAIGDSVAVERADGSGTYVDIYGSDGALRSTVQLDRMDLPCDSLNLARGNDDRLYALSVSHGGWLRVDGSTLVFGSGPPDGPYYATSTAWQPCFEGPQFGFDVVQMAGAWIGSTLVHAWGPGVSGVCTHNVVGSYLVLVLINGAEPILSVNNDLVRINADLSLTLLYTAQDPRGWEIVQLPSGEIIALSGTVFAHLDAPGGGFQPLPVQPGTSYAGLHVEEDGQLYTAQGRLDLSTGAVQPVFDPYMPSGQFVVTSDSVVFFVEAGHLYRLGDGGRNTRFGLDPADLLHYADTGDYGFGYALAPSYQWIGTDSTSLPAWAPHWTTIAPADFNGDGATDLFFYNRDTGQFAKGLNVSGCPSVVPCMSLAYFGYAWAPGWDVTVGDFDRNGLSDVFLYNAVSGDWFLCRSVGDGAGDFVYTSGQWAPGWTITRADWGAEGAGLFLYNPTNGSWFRVTFDAVGNLGYPAAGTWAPNWEIHPADFNGDGVTDLFLYASAGPNAGRSFRVTTVDGQFAYEEGPVWASDWTVSILDLDGDGASDVFLYRTSDGRYFETFWQGDHYDYYGGIWANDWSLTAIHRTRGPDALFLNGPSSSFLVTPGARGELFYTMSAPLAGRVISLAR